MSRRNNRTNQRKQPQRRLKRGSRIDRLIAVLPVSHDTLRRIASWSIVSGVAALAIVAASWLGIPGAVGIAVAEEVGRAGFRVEQIQVTGARRLDPMTVYAVALDQKSRAMPLVDLNAVRTRLLQYGWVADAHVSRRLPDTLFINIVERTPVAIWQDKGQLSLIDRDGVFLEPVSAAAMPDLPLVIGPGADQQEPAYQRLMAVAPALRSMVRAATWIGNRRWDLLFESGETLSLPEGEVEAARALRKFAKLDGARALLGKGWIKFDMRDPTRLVARKPGGVGDGSITDPAGPAGARTAPVAGRDGVGEPRDRV
ncbi:cell division protein FtsQ/DivIB [uncultured Sphingomonas sp.]|uniref:cell division protein FtsQ/DivIB n=1 Tax=uncultured Sphingomonas sp. TaxID=158754 RepID=UPI0035CAAD2A